MPGRLEQRLAEGAGNLERSRNLLLESSQLAGSQRNWPLARRLVELAERTDRLREEVQSLTAEVAGVGERTAAVSSGEAAEEPNATHKPCPFCRAEDNWQGASKCLKCGYDFATHRRQGFPKFRIKGGLLVKEGLKRDGLEVYEHKVAHAEFLQVITALTRLAADQDEDQPREWGLEEVEENLTCPKYVIYTVVLLLQQEKLIERPRKGAYVFISPETFASQAAGLWTRLQKAEPG